MTLKKKRKFLSINQGKHPPLVIKRIEKLKLHKDHYLQLLKEDLFSNESRKLVYFQLQKLFKKLQILEKRKEIKRNIKKE